MDPESCPSYLDTSLCLMGVVGESLGQDQEETLMQHVGSAAGEYLETGDIRLTWRRLRQYPHVNTAVSCLHTANNCDLN